MKKVILLLLCMLGSAQESFSAMAAHELDEDLKSFLSIEGRRALFFRYNPEADVKEVDSIARTITAQGEDPTASELDVAFGAFKVAAYAVGIPDGETDLDKWMHSVRKKHFPALAAALKLIMDAVDPEAQATLDALNARAREVLSPERSPLYGTPVNTGLTAAAISSRGLGTPSAGTTPDRASQITASTISMVSSQWAGIPLDIKKGLQKEYKDFHLWRTSVRLEMAQAKMRMVAIAERNRRKRERLSTVGEGSVRSATTARSRRSSSGHAADAGMIAGPGAGQGWGSDSPLLNPSVVRETGYGDVGSMDGSRTPPPRNPVRISRYDGERGATTAASPGTRGDGRKPLLKAVDPDILSDPVAGGMGPQVDSRRVGKPKEEKEKKCCCCRIMDMILGR